MSTVVSWFAMVRGGPLHFRDGKKILDCNWEFFRVEWLAIGTSAFCGH